MAARVRSHLFVAPTGSSFGELVLGLRLAQELRARGDEVSFLAPSANEVLFRDTGIQRAPIEKLLPALDRALPDVLRQGRFDSVVLVDLLVTLLAMRTHRIDPTFVDQLPVQVHALDIWDLRRADLRLDVMNTTILLPESARQVAHRRLVPVPFARLDSVGAYRALPAVPARFDAAERRQTRAALGVDECTRLVVFSTSQFQHASLSGLHPALAALPRRTTELCLGIDDRVKLLHVGPERIADAARYRHHPQVPALEYQRLLHASDLFVTMNQSATSISSALALDVPVLVAISGAPPLPFRIYPFGFRTFMAPVLAGNPFASVAPSVEIVPGDVLVDAARALLFDDDLRRAVLARSHAYLDDVRKLPSGAAAFDAF